jgi:hypothetical protein
MEARAVREGPTLVRDATLCEDATSTVFTTALAQLGRFRGDGSFAGWLFQVATEREELERNLRLLAP